MWISLEFMRTVSIFRRPAAQAETADTAVRRGHPSRRREVRRRIRELSGAAHCVRLVPPVGFEPTIVGLKVRCLNQLGHRGGHDVH